MPDPAPPTRASLAAALLAAHPDREWRAAEVAEALGWTTHQAARTLHALAGQGRAVRVWTSASRSRYRAAAR